MSGQKWEDIPDEYKPYARFVYTGDYGKLRKWIPNGVEWSFWRSKPYPKICEYLYYFYWFNAIKKEYRYFGPYDMWYDGPHKSFGFWWFNISWRTKWSKVEGW